MTAPAASADVQTAIFKKLYPVDFLRRHLDEQVREDGRAPAEFRAASVATGILSQSNGSALVRFGSGTMVTAAVQAQVTEPHHDRPNEGFIVPSLDLSPLCSPQYKPGPPSDDAQCMAHYLQLFLDQSLAVSRESLCIEPGVAAWALHVDVVVVSADGNVLDAAALAVVAALADCRLPTLLQCSGPSSCVFSRERNQKLDLRVWPVLSTFGLYDSTYILADPAAFEESLLSAHMHIGMTEADDDADVFFVRLAGNAMAAKAGPQVLRNEALLEQCIHAARARTAVLRKLLRESLKQ